MSIATEIQRIKDNISNTYTALGDKGATLPELQNSNNLADTVATITTGGGGSTNPLFAKVDTIIKSIPKTSYTTYRGVSDEVKKTFFPNNFVLVNINQGFIDTFGDGCGLIGYVFNENAPNVIYTNTSVFSIPDSASYEILSSSLGSGLLTKITFTDEKYIIYSAQQLLENRQEYNNCIFLDETKDASIKNGLYNYIEYAIYRYCCSDGEAFFKHEEWLFGGHFGNLQLSRYLKDINFIDCAHTVGSVISGASAFYDGYVWKSPYIDLTDILMKTSDETYSYGVTALTANATKQALTNTLARPVVLNFRGRHPFVFDLSSFTDSTLYMNASDITMSSNKYHCSSMYNALIIPSANSNLDFSCNSTSLQTISSESLKFLAEHSPNVSGKSIKIGSNTINIINIIDNTIIPLLQSKGWTVS